MSFDRRRRHLTISLLSILAGCGSGSGDDTTATGSAGSSSTSSSTTAATTAASTTTSSTSSTTTSTDPKSVSSTAATVATYTAPAMIVRTNSIYFNSSTGSDSNPGTAAAPLRDVYTAFQNNKIPSDCNVLFQGSTFTCTNSAGLLTTYNASSSMLNNGIVLPTGLTFAPASGVWRGTVVSGVAGQGGNAVTLQSPTTTAGNSVLDWQFWGLGFENWSDSNGTGGSGTFTLIGQMSQIRFDGLYTSNNGFGQTNLDHLFYFAGAQPANASLIQTEIYIRGCTSVETGNNGYWLHVYNESNGYSANNVTVEGNSVQWTGNGGMLLSQNFVPSCVWLVDQNDIRVDGSAAVSSTGGALPSNAISFYSAYGPQGDAGSTFTMSDNLFALTGARSGSAVVADAGSTPTSTGNEIYAGSSSATSGFTLGSGDAVIYTLPAQMIVVAP